MERRKNWGGAILSIISNIASAVLAWHAAFNYRVTRWNLFGFAALGALIVVVTIVYFIGGMERKNIVAVIGTIFGIAIAVPATIYLQNVDVQLLPALAGMGIVAALLVIAIIHLYLRPRDGQNTPRQTRILRRPAAVTPVNPTNP